MSSVETVHAPTAEQFENLIKELEQAQRLAAIGELTSTTAHEFNNLLMTILNYAKLGLRSQDTAAREKSLRKIHDAAVRASKITGTILGVAKNRSGGLEPTDLKQVIEDAMMLLEREMRKYRVSVEMQLDDVPAAMASGNQIQRVLLNLLTNARQAMPGGGTLRIKLHHDEKAKQIVLTVRDSGAGIPADQLPRIFDPFYSTKSGPDDSGKGGTGLGLSACRDIIESHRGKIRVESSPGKGTAFIIGLPLAGEKAITPMLAAM